MGRTADHARSNESHAANRGCAKEALEALELINARTIPAAAKPHLHDARRAVLDLIYALSEEDQS